MKIVRDGIELCEDCLIAACNDDYSGLDYYLKEPEATERMHAIQAGLFRLGRYLVPNFDSETGQGCNDFSMRPCGCCGSRLHGSRHEFAVLGE